MKYQYKFLSIVLAGGMLTACSSDEPGTLLHPSPASFSAQIGNANSRAVGAEWANGDAIGIFGFSGAKAYSNVEYTTVSGDGIFAPAGDAIYYQTTDPVTFTAYYPYLTELGADGIITVSTADQSTPSSFDFLWGQATGSYEYPEVRFNFAHRMAQLNISFTNGNDVDLSGLTCTIDGLIADGTFNTVTGEVAATGSEATITASLTAEHKSSLIVFPQVAERLVINARADGHDYRCYLYLGSLNSGSNYNVSIAVSKNEMTVTDCTIIPWGDGGNIDAEVNPKIAKVGDYYYSDGTYSTEYDASKNVVGIIFYVGHHPKDGSDYSASGIGKKECHGYVMALSAAYEWNVAWYDFNENPVGISGISTDTGDWNGYANQKAIERFVSQYQSAISLSNFPAAYKCSIYGTDKSDHYSQFQAPKNSSGWFLPSVGQFLGFHAANCEKGNLLNDKITAVESVSNRVGNLRYADSWCSTMNSNSSAYHVFFPEADSGNVSISTMKISGTTYVRAMLAF